MVNLIEIHSIHIIMDSNNTARCDSFFTNIDPFFSRFESNMYEVIFELLIHMLLASDVRLACT